MVVETIEKEHLSIRATMQEFGINDHKIIERWERIYLEEGPEGFAVERRSRGSTDGQMDLFSLQSACQRFRQEQRTSDAGCEYEY